MAHQHTIILRRSSWPWDKEDFVWILPRISHAKILDTPMAHVYLDNALACEWPALPLCLHRVGVAIWTALVSRVDPREAQLVARVPRAAVCDITTKKATRDDRGAVEWNGEPHRLKVDLGVAARLVKPDVERASYHQVSVAKHLENIDDWLPLASKVLDTWLNVKLNGACFVTIGPPSSGTTWKKVGLV
eukprot:CAMPEP_0174700928 /NCGR_PEP_ID=MMETSP1094-20130205/5736_1 /TAXON_ID=156173 /ORGANISM="Chrysochromulina brevifilum, Strain UTEX LB 985" /LENGTH=188 /DNA_ID=CAMNT_0015898497 /DNA_START=375 /DNA_END=942 /DNA_ORIENTATION=+